MIFLQKSDIKIIDIELSNICNFSCKLCLSKNEKYKNIFKAKNIDCNYLKNILNEFQSLNTVVISGLGSEPTLYPDFLDLIQYLNSRDIKIQLYTNGSLINDNFWKKLASTLKQKDEVIFTICGSTQELHEKYRVGSNLEYMFHNIKVFKENSKYDIDNGMYIKFEYNRNDWDNIEKVLSGFSKKSVIFTTPSQERFDILDKNTDICLPSEVKKRFISEFNLVKFVYNRKIKNNNFRKLCYSYNRGQIVIDNFGKIYPCNSARFFDYSLEIKNDFLIYDDKIDLSKFCYECDFQFQNFLGKFKIDMFNNED